MLTGSTLLKADDDIVIYGGTSAGVTAAIEASRLGKSVTLIEPTGHLGGLTTGGLGFTDVGDVSAIGGLSREFYHRIWLYYKDPARWTAQTRDSYVNAPGQNVKAIDDKDQVMWNFEPHAAEQVIDQWLAESTVKVALRERLDRKHPAAKSGSQITSIQMQSGKTFAAKVFIDASYEGDLMAAAGVSYTVGREANVTYGETLNGIETIKASKNQLPAGIDAFVKSGDPASGFLPGINRDPGGADGTADRKIQAYCYRMCLCTDPANRLPIEKPADYREADFEILLRALEAGQKGRFFKFDAMPNRKTDSNNTGGISTDLIGQNYDYPEGDDAVRDQICRAHRRWQLGLIWTLQHDPRVPEKIRAEYQKFGLPREEFADTDHFSRQLYIREARRMVGLMVETERTLRDDRDINDSIGLGSYQLDSHNVQRYVDTQGHVRNEGDVEIGVPRPYRISYRCILPRQAECSNLLVPVCLSASHVAYGSIRMEPVFMVLGQSAGTAAALAVGQGTPVQQVKYSLLQTRLQRDGQRLQFP